MHVVIDRETCEFPAGWSVLEGRVPPAFICPPCATTIASSLRGIRLCLVSVKGWNKPRAACTTALSEGMEIETDTPELDAGRRSLRAARQPLPG